MSKAERDSAIEQPATSNSVTSFELNRRKFLQYTPLALAELAILGAFVWSKLDDLQKKAVDTQLLFDPAVQELVFDAEDKPCRAASTYFRLSPHQITMRKKVVKGDSIEQGVNGTLLDSPSSLYQVYGMNKNFRNYASKDHRFKEQVLWIAENEAMRDTILDDWEQQLKWEEINKILQGNYKNVKSKVDLKKYKGDNRDIPQSHEFGAGGSKILYKAAQLKKQLLSSLKNPEQLGSRDLAKAFVETIKDSKYQYMRLLANEYWFMQHGVPMDIWELYGMPDPFVLDTFPIEDTTTGETFYIDTKGKPQIKKYARKIISLMNNAVKDVADDALDRYPDIQTLYIHTPDYLTAEDMHDIHPNEMGYWKIARASLDHYIIAGSRERYRYIPERQVGPIALPDDDPNMPQIKRNEISFNRGQLIYPFRRALQTFFESPD